MGSSVAPQQCPKHIKYDFWIQVASSVFCCPKKTAFTICNCMPSTQQQQQNFIRRKWQQIAGPSSDRSSIGHKKAKLNFNNGSNSNVFLCVHLLRTGCLGSTWRSLFAARPHALSHLLCDYPNNTQSNNGSLNFQRREKPYMAGAIIRFWVVHSSMYFLGICHFFASFSCCVPIT